MYVTYYLTKMYIPYLPNVLFTKGKQRKRERNFGLSNTAEINDNSRY